jgi:putative DNA primase/helicase
MNIKSLLSRLKGVRSLPSGSFQALCPVHGDNDPSLSITSSDGRILLHCHAGCCTEAIVTKLGLSMRDLFLDAPPADLGSKTSGKGKSRKLGEPVKIYDYQGRENGPGTSRE